MVNKTLAVITLLAILITLAGIEMIQPSVPIERNQIRGAEISYHDASIRSMPGVGSTITEANVARYVDHTPLPLALPGSYVSSIDTPQLISSKKVSMLLHGEQTGYTDSVLLWYVTLHGRFLFSAVAKRIMTSHISYEVFDSITGRLIMFGSVG